MKKFLILVSSIVSLVATSAFAKTEGSSVGLGILKSEIVHKNSWDKNTPYDDKGKGVSLNYKYAIPLTNDFYVAPGVAYDRIGTSTDTTSTLAADRVDVNNRYSARADLGYDINDHLAAYALVGYSLLGYETYNNNGTFPQKKNAFNYAPLFGAGFKTAISKNFDLTVEYTNQHANLKTSDPYQKVKTKLETYSIGVAYNF